LTVKPGNLGKGTPKEWEKYEGIFDHSSDYCRTG